MVMALRCFLDRLPGFIGLPGLLDDPSVWAIYQGEELGTSARMMLSLKSWSKVSEENGIYVYFIGMLFG
jgi:hypothetical protein